MDHRAGEERRPLRQYRQRSGERDVDAFERANLIRAAVWSLPGAALGVLAAVAAVALGGWSLPAAVLAGALVWLATFVTPLIVAVAGGRAAGTLFNPTGRSTPRKREHSHAESLVARGLYREAIEAYEFAIAELPSDPEPYLRIARIERDHLGRYHEAVRWLRNLLSVPGLAPGLRALATREVVELYDNKLREPGRAAPLLARLAGERAGTPEGIWAAEELARVKASMGQRRQERPKDGG